MYEMYPDVWTTSEPPRAVPRRRPRKEHSVVPPVIAHQLQLRAGRTG